MITLKVYDTVSEAQKNAKNEYRDYIIRGIDNVIKFNCVQHPYQMKVNDDWYVYAANNPIYLLGMWFDKIEDYTRSGVCDEIRECMR